MLQNNVSFTKDLSKTNRKNGEWLLGYYWRESKLSKAPYYPITNWEGMIGFLDKNYPTYIEFLGEQLKAITSDKLIEAMKRSARKGFTDYPRPSYFADALSVAGSVSTFDAVKNTAKEVGKDIVDYASTFSTLVLIGAVVFAGAYLYSLAPGKFRFKK